MNAIFAGTKVITTGITHPSQLNRGEIAFFTSAGELVSAGTTITSKSPFIGYKGLGDNQYINGVSLVKGSIGYTSESYKAAVNGSASFEDMVLSLPKSNINFTVNVVDPFTTSNFPKQYIASVLYDDTLTDAHLLNALAKRIKTLNAQIKTDFKGVSIGDDWTVVVTDDKITVTLPSYPCGTILSAQFDGLEGDVVIIEPEAEIGGGKDIVEEEQVFSHYRGNNPNALAKEGAFTAKWFTAKDDVKYKQFIISTMSEGPQSTLSTEDSKGYLHTMVVALDASNAANLTAADDLFKTF